MDTSYGHDVPSVPEQVVYPTFKPPDTHTAPDLIRPEDLVYKGAFRLPDSDGSDQKSWDWGGSAMVYYPNGDLQGLNDGYPGSIFATGHQERSLRRT